MKLRKFALALAALLALGAAACAADLDVLRVGMINDAKSLDPLKAVDTISFAVLKHINEPLVTVDGKTKQLVPVLAEKWEITDPLTYKFYLKKGVKFHNGEELTADDVVYSFKRAMSKESVYAKSKAKYIDPNGFEVIDRYTVVVKTVTPFGGFLESMKHPWASIFSKKAVEDAGDDYFRRPVGTGPYKFDKWIKGEKCELSAFDGYHGEKPHAKKIVFLVMSDDSSRVIALETGKADMIYSVPSSDFDRLESEGRVKAVKGTGHNIIYLGMNTQKGALADPRVRLAIDYAIDKDAYTHVVYQDKAAVLDGPLPFSSSFTPEGSKRLPCDPDKARALLKEAGYEKGLTLNLWIESNQNYINGATVLQSMLGNVGINVKIITLESGVFDDRVTTGEQDMIISTWGMQTNRDAGQFWLSLFHSHSIGSTNWSLTKDETIDKNIELGNASVDPETRRQAFQAVWDRLGELRPFVSLAVPNELYAGRKDLKGMEDFCDGRLNYLGNLTVE
ncbi:MAG: ABC transporter substrate-binding protein [Pyramidobacter sp.]|nr:ABC transporter substrate-binding protein [Pyramidobacter sp.]